MTMTQVEALDAMLQHHRTLVGDVDARIRVLAEAVDSGTTYQPAVVELITYLAEEVIPHAVAEELSSRYKVPFLYRDFREGWREGQTAARSLGIYRQSYCGCIFSEYERFAARPQKRAGKP